MMWRFIRARLTHVQAHRHSNFLAAMMLAFQFACRAVAIRQRRQYRFPQLAFFRSVYEHEPRKFSRLLGRKVSSRCGPLACITDLCERGTPIGIFGNNG